jgi:hypothetical protein
MICSNAFLVLTVWSCINTFIMHRYSLLHLCIGLEIGIISHVLLDYLLIASFSFRMDSEEQPDMSFVNLLEGDIRMENSFLGESQQVPASIDHS